MAKLYLHDTEDVNLGFGKHVHTYGHLLQTFEELPHYPDMYLAKLVLTKVSPPPQEQLAHSLATMMALLRSLQLEPQFLDIKFQLHTGQIHNAISWAAKSREGMEQY